MKLEFRLLVVDDNPSSVDEAASELADYLSAKGFSFTRTNAEDLSDQGLRKFAKRSGRDFDLVIVDYHLGEGVNGAVAAGTIRNQLPFTDIIFYSSNNPKELLEELAKEEVAGVFVSIRTGLGDALRGIADTIISKAIDLNHMRGIAMSEVAEMDVMMEDLLTRVFASGDERFQPKAQRTLDKLLDSSRHKVDVVEPMARNGLILDAISNADIFGSAHKYMAVCRVAKALDVKPSEALDYLKSYETDVIRNRNTLAHAKEERDEDGQVTLRSIKKGENPTVIDDEWMVQFRGKLRDHRSALGVVCQSLDAYLQGRAAG
ncbi:hypothetical protein SH203_02964 [Brevundimonas sp. SH203]|nr:hypothetical protein SH203_02964 [Brevundimonas sp. SH203]